MQVTVKANFNKQTKDSKKELIQFYVKGEDEKKQELSQMTREVVELRIEGVDQTLTCEFNKTSKDSKKTVLDFIVKGDTSSDQSFNFYKMAGSDVTLHIIESQMSIDEFHDADHEGVKYKVHPDGTADVSPNQMSLDDVEDVEDKEEELPFTDIDDNEDPFDNEVPFDDDDLLD
jgi:hypothetical protein